MDRTVKLILFVASAENEGRQVIDAIRRFCDTELAGRHELTIVDLLENIEMAFQYKILSIPTLIKESPAPNMHFIGKLEDLEALRQALLLDEPGAKR